MRLRAGNGVSLRPLSASLALAAAAITGCAHLGPENYGFSGALTSPTASPSPANCPIQTASASKVIGMSPTALVPYSDPTYGTISGYAGVSNASLTQGATIQATTLDTIQFENFDTAAEHSAVGFPQTFQTAPYTFPPAAPFPSANTIIGSTFWSTGLNRSIHGNSVPFPSIHSLGGNLLFRKFRFL